MNKVTKAFATFFALALVLVIGALVVGCKGDTTTEPSSATTYDSEAAADMTATALGNQSGGLGMSLGDSYALATTGAIPHSSADSKGNPIMNVDSSYDPTTGWHTLNITKNITWNNKSVSATFIYKYQLIDTTGAFQAKWKKGLINNINVEVAVPARKKYLSFP